VFVLYPALTIQECAQESRALCLDVTGLLSFVPCRGLDPRYPLITVSLSSISVIHRKLEFLVHATFPPGMGADTKLTKRTFFQRAVSLMSLTLRPWARYRACGKTRCDTARLKLCPFKSLSLPQALKSCPDTGLYTNDPLLLARLNRGEHSCSGDSWRRLGHSR
jgi:hypothetical protein